MNKLDRIIYKSGYRKDFVAKKLRVHPVNISRWVKGTKPSPKYLIKLCEFFNCNEEDIV